MRIGICNDHAGVELKGAISALLQELGHEVVDFGCFDAGVSVDYPDYAHQLGAAVAASSVECGVAICGTGNGMAITLNHHHGVRAGLAWSPEIASLVKRHNNANILVLSARFVPLEVNLECVRTWLSSEFEGGRHANRIAKIEAGC